MKNPYKAYPQLDLLKQGSWPAAKHEYDHRSALALIAAEATGRPLLVKGEPGSGKSQLARYAAAALKRQFISTVITAGTQSQDLLWVADDLARLAQAQMSAQTASHAVSQRQLRNPRQIAKKAKHLLAPERFISPGPLWWAYDHASAWQQYCKCQHRLLQPPEQPQESLEQDSERSTQLPPSAPYVVLIDEIDKADSELPNSLLEVLGNADFHVPTLQQTVRSNPNVPAPLVIITSNAERELPPAFVRRCVVLDLDLPKDKHNATQHLVQRGRVHQPDMAETVLSTAAEYLWDDREAARLLSEPFPGQAEYLDMLRVLVSQASDLEAQLSLLEDMRQYLFRKALPELEADQDDNDD